MVGAEIAQGAVQGVAGVLRGPVEGAGGAVVVEAGGELGCDHRPVPVGAEGLAQQLLVAEGAVGLGGVEEGDAEVEGVADGGGRLLLVGGAVEGAHPHAPQPDGGDLKPLRAQWCRAHVVSFRRRPRSADFFHRASWCALQVKCDDEAVPGSPPSSPSTSASTSTTSTSASVPLPEVAPLPPGGVLIGEVAALLGISIDTVRYYERTGLTLSPPKRGSDGWRRYGSGTWRGWPGW